MGEPGAIYIGPDGGRKNRLGVHGASGRRKVGPTMTAGPVAAVATVAGEVGAKVANAQQDRDAWRRLVVCWRQRCAADGARDRSARVALREVLGKLDAPYVCIVCACMHVLFQLDIAVFPAHSSRRPQKILDGDRCLRKFYAVRRRTDRPSEDGLDIFAVRPALVLLSGYNTKSYSFYPII